MASIYRAVDRVDNRSFTAAAAAAKMENTTEKAPSEGVEEPLPEGIWNVRSAYMRSLHAELVGVLGCDGQVLPYSLYCFFCA